MFCFFLYKFLIEKQDDIGNINDKNNDNNKGNYNDDIKSNAE